MRLTASHIVDWVNTNTKEAQSNLPRWVRRLCFDPETTRQLSFPSGDSTYVPGWDGVLSSVQGNAWIPAGQSRWEIGCDQDIASKANSDYRKRTEQTSEEERFGSTFVFVTPRRWTKKKTWVAEQTAKGEWADVRAYDADDLEQWLEQSPSVALQFGEELGVLGPGVESCLRHWRSWSQQCSPAITTDALFMDRAGVREALTEGIRAALSQPEMAHPLVIRADSVEEAAAFAVATLLSAGDFPDQALVVTETGGWRYVDANPQLKIAVAADPEVASMQAMRQGLLVIVPNATGNGPGKFMGDEVVLERPNIYEFEKALVAMGMEESDATRFAQSTGRSWTVLRRRRATNPAIQTPNWLDVPQSASLALLCLLGTWDADNEADRQVVARLAARPYEDVEQDLRLLATLDDAPLLCIGSVWKAKSPLELLSLFGDRITRDQLDRFFSIAREMLSTPDPQLELPDEERWMAQVHGKVHPFSGLMFESICDALVKLAVRGPDQAGLRAMGIEDHVASLVHDMLNEADATRWLSLASYLPTLAEAAPDAFLRAVEKSLQLPDSPVARLITETSSSGLGGRCWHAGLLWALEILAWAPNRLARVALILACLSHIPMKGNWGNKPNESLLGLFRSWLPQTAAGFQERIKVLDLLIQKDAEASFDVLEGLLAGGPQSATPAARPKWREDDAGAGQGVPNNEKFSMLAAAKERILKLSVDSAPRIASLMQNTVLRHQKEIPKLLALMEPFTMAEAHDEDREMLCASLRQTINWHRNYDQTPTDELDVWLKQVEDAYLRLAPLGLIARHRWLFSNYWVDLPSKDRDDDIRTRDNVIAATRIDALTEIFHASGMAGIESLISVCGEPGAVGMTLSSIQWPGVTWPEWLVAQGGEFTLGQAITQCIASMLNSMPSPNSEELVTEVLEIALQQEWNAQKRARFLVLAKAVRETWQIATECGTETEGAYWQLVRPQHRFHDADLAIVMRRLLEAKRPRSALQCCQYTQAQPDPKVVFSALQQSLAGEEAKGPKLDSWHLGKMLESLEKSGQIEEMALIQLEFNFFPALGYGQEDKAAALYASIMSKPALFVELISMIYKPRNGEREEPVLEGARIAATHARQILRACTRQPGTRCDGSVDKDAFFEFIDTVRELCRKSDRLAVGEITLGEILAYAPEDDDGTWSHLPAREILDRPELEDMRRGFRTGTWNKRGVTSRSPWDGGGQERDLAAYYSGQAERVQHSHPNVAAMLEGIAKSYERHGRREDNEANLRKEGF